MYRHSTQCCKSTACMNLQMPILPQSQLSEHLLFNQDTSFPFMHFRSACLMRWPMRLRNGPRRILQKLNPHIKYMTARMHCVPWQIPEKNVPASTSSTCGACAQCVPEGTRCAVHAVQAGVRYFQPFVCMRCKQWEAPPELQCRQKGTGMRCIFPVPQRLLGAASSPAQSP